MELARAHKRKRVDYDWKRIVKFYRTPMTAKWPILGRAFNCRYNLERMMTYRYDFLTDKLPDDLINIIFGFIYKKHDKHKVYDELL